MLTAASAKPSSRRKLEPIEQRPSSAQANILSHPCFQGSLFSDNVRATGNVQEWKERLRETQKGNEEFNEKSDYQLQNVIWAQSVNFKIN